MPESSVKLTIAADSLQILPDGASYSAKSGQARVEVSRVRNATNETERIVVYATCDSLQLVCEEYEQTIRFLRNDIAFLETKDSLNHVRELSEKHSASGWAVLKGGIIGFIFGVVVGFFLTAALVIYIKKK